MKRSDIPFLFPVSFASEAPENLVNYPLPRDHAEEGRASLAQGFSPKNFLPLAAGGIPVSGADTAGILKMLSMASKAGEAGQIRSYNADYAREIGGYPAGSLVGGVMTPTMLYYSLCDDNLANPEETTNPASTASPWLGFDLKQPAGRYLPLTGGILTGDVDSDGSINDDGTYYGGRVNSTVPGQKASAALQLQGKKDDEMAVIVLQDESGHPRLWQFRTNGTVTDPNGDTLLTGQRAEEIFLPLTGGTVTGEIDLIGKGSYEDTLFGGTAPSKIINREEKAYLQLQGSGNDLRAIIVFYDGAGSFKTWQFDPKTGQVVDPNNQISATQDWCRNHCLQLPPESGPRIQQTFIVQGWHPDGNNNMVVQFPAAFSNIPIVSLTVIHNDEIPRGSDTEMASVFLRTKTGFSINGHGNWDYVVGFSVIAEGSM